MTLCCFIPKSGPDRYVGVAGWPSTIEHCGAVYHRTSLATHGGWLIYREEPSDV